METEEKLLKFLHLAEGLKTELRNGYTTQGRRESVADHVWRLALMLLLFSKHLDKKFCLEKALKLAIIHDLAELVTGDAPYFVYEGQKELRDEKFQQELNAMQYLRSLLPEDKENDIVDLWKEYEQALTYEAKLVKALDKIEAQIQHNEMCFSHWNEHDLKYAPVRLNKYCEFDQFLQRFKNVVQNESLKKIRDHLGSI